MKILYTFKDTPADEVLSLIQSHRAAGHEVETIDLTETVDYERFVALVEDAGLIISC